MSHKYHQRFSKSIRQFIRQEKARFRRQISDLVERKKQIQEFYKNLIK